MDEGSKDDELLNAYSFVVYFGKNTVISFSRISNISIGQDVEMVQDGGRRGRMRMRPTRPREQETKRRGRKDIIVFERGVSTGSDDTSLRKLKPGTRVANLQIAVMHNDKMERTFNIEEGIIMRCTVSDLDALRSEVMIRRMEIQHTGIVEE